MKRRLATALALAACSAVIAACGGDEEGEPIPQDLAASMQQQLDNIRGQIENGTLGACEDILSSETDATFATLQREAQQVPSDVDSDLRDALEQSIDRLRELVQQECDSLAEEEAKQQETEPVEPVPAPEEEIPEETIPEETIPEEENEQEGEGLQPGQGGTPPGQGGTPPGQEGDSGGVVVPEEGGE